MVMEVASSKRFMSTSLQGFHIPTQSLVGSRHSSHGHLNRRGLANFSRCKMPKPPRCLGLQSVS
jgi:hypothetical protein